MNRNEVRKIEQRLRDLDQRKVAAEVAERIRSHGEHYDQMHWFTTSTGVDVTKFTQQMDDWDCGTAACVAGHAAHVAVLEGAVTAPQAMLLSLEAVGAMALGLQDTIYGDGTPGMFLPSAERAYVLKALDRIAA